MASIMPVGMCLYSFILYYLFLLREEYAAESAFPQQSDLLELFSAGLVEVIKEIARTILRGFVERGVGLS